MGVLRRRRHVHVCPLCGGTVERVHRHPADRFFALFRTLHRYRCVATGCAWEGIISDDVLREQGARVEPRPTGWRTRAVWFFVGAAVALAGVQGARMYRAQIAAREAQQASARDAARKLAVAPLPVEIGESFDGEPLAEDDLRKVDNPSPLTLRRGCAWGIPGRNPYRGTVAQALTAARMPDSAIRKFEALIEKKVISDRLEISRDGITTVSGRRKFDALSFDMAFGNIMCYNTRVNFVRGHVEHADLYEASDADGTRYAVMVPYVCGNVAVLADRAERNGEFRNGRTPEPQTLALFATGSALLLWFAARRRRAGRSADTGAEPRP